MKPKILDDRRNSRRLKARDNSVTIRWHWRNATVYDEGVIINVSQTGALIATKARLSLDGFLLLRMEQPEVSDWEGARVVRLEEDGRLALEFNPRTQLLQLLA